MSPALRFSLSSQNNKEAVPAIRDCLSVVLDCLFTDPASAQKFYLPKVNETIRNLSNCRHHGGDKPEDLFHVVVFTLVISRLTARRAATIEPTTEEPTSKVRAPKERPNSNSTMLSSMRTSLRPQWRVPDARVFIDNGGRAVLFPRCRLNHASVEATVGRASRLFLIVESPQSMRQKIREARKPLPLRRGRGEAMIESGIQYKILPDRIRDGPQIPDGISAGEWLREMPELACDCQPPQWV